MGVPTEPPVPQQGRQRATSAAPTLQTVAGRPRLHSAPARTAAPTTPRTAPPRAASGSQSAPRPGRSRLGRFKRVLGVFGARRRSHPTRAALRQDSSFDLDASMMATVSGTSLEGCWVAHGSQLRRTEIALQQHTLQLGYRLNDSGDWFHIDLINVHDVRIGAHVDQACPGLVAPRPGSPAPGAQPGPGSPPGEGPGCGGCFPMRVMFGRGFVLDGRLFAFDTSAARDRWHELLLPFCYDGHGRAHQRVWRRSLRRSLIRLVPLVTLPPRLTGGSLVDFARRLGVRALDPGIATVLADSCNDSLAERGVEADGSVEELIWAQMRAMYFALLAHLLHTPALQGYVATLKKTGDGAADTTTSVAPASGGKRGPAGSAPASGHASGHLIAFLHSSGNSAVVQAPEDLSLSLADYFIASSHNTYLIGKQAFDVSSAEAYARAIEMGARCVEIDAWDSVAGPVVTHGRMFTTHVPFLDVVEAINTAAFRTTDSPLIISLENHCSKDNQDVMADTMRRVFGDRLLTRRLHGVAVPSPDCLRGRILLKFKKNPVGKAKSDTLIASFRAALSLESRATAAATHTVDEGRCTVLITNSQLVVASPLGAPGAPEPLDTDALALMCETEDAADTSGSTPLTPTSLASHATTATTSSRRLLRLHRFGEAVAEPAEPGADPREVRFRVRGGGQALVCRFDAASDAVSCRMAIDSGEWLLRLQSEEWEIARSLSDLVVYTEARKFADGLPKDLPPDTMCVTSLKEGHATRLASRRPADLSRAATKLLLRVYPNGTRVNSSNYDPVPLWLAGAQMVALNYQTHGPPLWLNRALFAAHSGGSGYSPKPAMLRDGVNLNLPAADRDTQPLCYSFHFLSGVHFPRRDSASASPLSLSVRIRGTLADQHSEKRVTSRNGSNALAAVWDYQHAWVVHHPELAFLCLVVHSGKKVLGQGYFRMDTLRKGLHSLPLFNVYNEPIELCHILIKLRIKAVKRKTTLDSQADATLQIADKLEDFVEAFGRLRSELPPAAAGDEQAVPSKPAQPATAELNGVARQSSGLHQPLSLDGFGRLNSSAPSSPSLMRQPTIVVRQTGPPAALTRGESVLGVRTKADLSPVTSFGRLRSNSMPSINVSVQVEEESDEEAAGGDDRSTPLLPAGFPRGASAGSTNSRGYSDSSETDSLVTTPQDLPDDLILEDLFETNQIRGLSFRNHFGPGSRLASLTKSESGGAASTDVDVDEEEGEGEEGEGEDTDGIDSDDAASCDSWSPTQGLRTVLSVEGDELGDTGQGIQSLLSQADDEGDDVDEPRERLQVESNAHHRGGKERWLPPPASAPASSPPRAARRPRGVSCPVIPEYRQSTAGGTSGAPMALGVLAEAEGNTGSGEGDEEALAPRAGGRLVGVGRVVIHGQVFDVVDV